MASERGCLQVQRRSTLQQCIFTPSHKEAHGAELRKWSCTANPSRMSTHCLKQFYQSERHKFLGPDSSVFPMASHSTLPESGISYFCLLKRPEETLSCFPFGILEETFFHFPWHTIRHFMLKCFLLVWTHLQHTENKVGRSHFLMLKIKKETLIWKAKLNMAAAVRSGA